MGKFALAKKEIEECIEAIQFLSQKDTGSQIVKDSFTIFPNGFFINNSINADSFLAEIIKMPSKKDKISKFLTSFQLAKKLGTTSLEISIPSSMLEKNEKISALKLVNDSLILWTDNFVYKIPATDKALKRLEMTNENLDVIKKLETELQKYFLIPKCIKNSNLILQCSSRCETLSLDNNSIPDIDSFLHRYFTRVFQSADLQNSIYRGFLHGDLHFGNILKNKNKKLFLTDLDLIKTNGFPFLDLMHFAVHAIRTIEQTAQYQPFELFLEEESYLFDKLVEHGFSKLSEIWLKYYQNDYISLYLQSRFEWSGYNKIVSEEFKRLEKLQKKYNL